MRVRYAVLLSGLMMLPATPVSADGRIHELIQHYQADFGALARKHTLTWSDEYFNRFEAFYTGYQQELNTVPFGDLDQAGKVDYLLFDNQLKRSAHELAENRRTYTRIKPHLPAPDSMLEFIQMRRYGSRPDAKKTASDFNEWEKEIQNKHSTLKNARALPRADARSLSAAISNYQAMVKEAYEFYYGYDPDFTWWTEKPWQKLDEAFKKYAVFAKDYFDKTTQKDDGSGIVGNPIGRDEIMRSLQFEMISYTPQQLIDIAERQFKWSEQEMLKASRELGYGNDWKAALEHVKQTYVDPGEQPEFVKFLADEAVEFLETRDLLTIPPLAKETWRMTMLSPQMQLVAPFFLGGEVVRIAYPTHTMEHEAQMMSLRGNNPHFSRAVVHHELIPGHHLQQFMNQRYNTQRRAFRTPFWSEGWALYWEMVLWDKGFPQTPEDRIGMLYWRMHRCARIVFSLNYHLGNWTPQQSIDYLVDKVGHERANAEAEVRRSFEGNYGPLYQIAYMVGAMQLYTLRMELVDGGNMTEKEFHDRILIENSIPIAMVKALLTNETLRKDYKPDWKWGEPFSRRF